MALTYSDLSSKYGSFQEPVAEIQVGDKKVGASKKGVGLSNITVDLTAGFEASQCRYCLYNCYSYDLGAFAFDLIKDYILIGSAVIVYLGYDTSVKEVFRGVISKVNFVIEEGDEPHVEVTAMDIKGVMMANKYNKQIKAGSYSEALKAMLDEGVYKVLQNKEVITKLDIRDTPDHQPGGGTEEETDVTIEMVDESDYEFAVKVGKKYNYEFFTIGGQVVFRKAKDDKSNLISINSRAKIKRLNVDYDITGLVEKVEVRGLDIDKAKPLTSSLKNSYSLSQGSNAKSIIAGSQYIYIDPTARSKDDAEHRANYLYEEMTYRYGTMELEMIGIPDIIPGRFMTLEGLGTGISNQFYIQNVRHTMVDNGEFSTRIIGKAAKAGSN